MRFFARELSRHEILSEADGPLRCFHAVTGALGRAAGGFMELAAWCLMRIGGFSHLAALRRCGHRML